MARPTHEMLPRCLWFLALGAILVAVEALPTGLGEEARKAAAVGADKPAEPKGTLSDSGLEDTDPASDSKQQMPKANPSAYPAEPAASAPASRPDKSYGVSSYYQEPRYKRELDLDPEEVFALLSLYDSERRNRGNWRNYKNDDYEVIDDEPNNMLGLDEEDPRAAGWAWFDSQVDYLQQPQGRYVPNDPLISSELAALEAARERSPYYEQYQQYDGGVQYGKPQYGLAYEQRPYYPPENRFIISRKRSQNYDSYGGRNGLILNSSGYPSYQHRLLY